MTRRVLSSAATLPPHRATRPLVHHDASATPPRRVLSSAATLLPPRATHTPPPPPAPRSYLQLFDKGKGEDVILDAIEYDNVLSNSEADAFMRYVRHERGGGDGQCHVLF